MSADKKWKPGDVALAEFTGEPDVRVVRYDWGWARLADLDDYIPDEPIVGAHRVGDPRRLIIVDPEDREQIRALADAAFSEVQGNTNRLQEALRSLIAEPEPEEPTGLGAVVRDGTGETWVRSQWDMNFPWCKAEVGDFKAGDPSGEYRDIPRPLTVLSPGWEPEQ